MAERFRAQQGGPKDCARRRRGGGRSRQAEEGRGRGRRREAGASLKSGLGEPGVEGYARGQLRQEADMPSRRLGLGKPLGVVLLQGRRRRRRQPQRRPPRYRLRPALRLGPMHAGRGYGFVGGNAQQDRS